MTNNTYSIAGVLCLFLNTNSQLKTQQKHNASRKPLPTPPKNKLKGSISIALNKREKKSSFDRNRPSFFPGVLLGQKARTDPCEAIAVRSLDASLRASLQGTPWFRLRAELEMKMIQKVFVLTNKNAFFDLWQFHWFTLSKYICIYAPAFEPPPQRSWYPPPPPVVWCGVVWV